MKSVNRRDFLKLSGTSLIGLTLGSVALRAQAQEQLQADESQKIVPETTKSDVKKKEAKTEETQLTSDNKKNADDEMNKLGNLKIPGRD